VLRAVNRLFDRLDECEGPERKQLLEILTEVVCRCDMADPGQLRLLVVSQDYADIRRGLHSSGATKIVPKVLRVTDADNKSDIQAYTKMHVDRIAGKFSPFTDDMSEYLRNLTVANADGELASQCCLRISYLNISQVCSSTLSSS
jgi:hypothetical protein